MTVQFYVIYRRSDGFVGFYPNKIPSPSKGFSYEEIARCAGYTQALDISKYTRRLEGNW